MYLKGQRLDPISACLASTTSNHISQQNDFIEYTVTDIMGKKIRSNSLSITAGTNILKINLNDLPEGVYLMNATSKKEGYRISERIVKLR